MKRADGAERAPNRDLCGDDSPAHLVAKFAHMGRMTTLAHHPFEGPARVLAVGRQRLLRPADEIVLGVRRPSGVPGAAMHLTIATANKVVSHAGCPVLTVRG